MPAISGGKKKRINHQKMNYIINLYNNTQQKEYISHKKREEKTGRKQQDRENYGQNKF